MGWQDGSGDKGPCPQTWPLSLMPGIPEEKEKNWLSQVSLQPLWCTSPKLFNEEKSAAISKLYCGCLCPLVGCAAGGLTLWNRTDWLLPCMCCLHNGSVSYLKVTAGPISESTPMIQWPDICGSRVHPSYLLFSPIFFLSHFKYVTWFSSGIECSRQNLW